MVLSAGMSTKMVLRIEAGEGGADAQAFVVDLGAAIGRWLDAAPMPDGTSVRIEVPGHRL